MVLRTVAFFNFSLKKTKISKMVKKKMFFTTVNSDEKKQKNEKNSEKKWFYAQYRFSILHEKKQKIQKS